MNKFTKLVLSVACPVCEMPIGKVCDKSTQASQLPYHHLRYLKACEGKGLPEGHLDLVLKPAYNKGSNPSGYCNRNEHGHCNGMCRPKHGLRLKCTCHCHDKERKPCT